MGAVTPSGKVLARAMARYVDPDIAGPVIELGPGTGAVTKALVERGIDPSRLVLVEFNPSFCRLLRTRYPDATVVQGDAYRIQHLLGGLLQEPAAAVVSGLPLVTKPFKQRLQLDRRGLRPDGAGRAVRAVHLRHGDADPEAARARRHAHASELIWQNLPPARVWVYRKRLIEHASRRSSAQAGARHGRPKAWCFAWHGQLCSWRLSSPDDRVECTARVPLSCWPMPVPKILVFAGSIRTGSYNARLAALAAKELALTGADVTRISLEDYPLPIYDGDDEARIRRRPERAQAQAADGSRIRACSSPAPNTTPRSRRC